MNGKGDKPRPLSIPMKEFDDKWDAIFKTPKTEEKDSNIGLDLEASNDELKASINLKIPF
jgi:hypothetical protein